MTRALALLFALLSGCGGDPTEEARRLLDRIDHLDLDDPPAERRRLVDNLASLPLVHEDVSTTRDLCVDAHRALLRAEELQAASAALLARYRDDETPSTADQLGIRQNLRDADASIERSRDLFARCHRQKHELDTRYRPRRR